MDTTRLTNLVDPQNAVVTRLIASLSLDRPPRERSVSDWIALLRQAFATWGTLTELGPSSYERTETLRAGNCVDIATLFCATARRIGCRTCHVVLGSWRHAFPAALHAWVLLYLKRNEWALINPTDMTVRIHRGAEIEDELTVLAIIDDTQVIFSASDRDEFGDTMPAKVRNSMSTNSETIDTRRPVRREPLSVEDQGAGFHAVLAGASARVLITNDVGRRVLELCDGERTETAIATALSDEYHEVAGGRIAADVHQFLESAADKGAVAWTS